MVDAPRIASNHQDHYAAKDVTVLFSSRPMKADARPRNRYRAFAKRARTATRAAAKPDAAPTPRAQRGPK